jgi:dTDP-4-amino-4,6-dideoxygalactose transaminase
MRKELLVFGSQTIEQTERDEVMAVMQSDSLGTGPKVAKFQQEPSEYKGQKARPLGYFGCSSVYLTNNVVTDESGMIIKWLL